MDVRYAERNVDKERWFFASDCPNEGGDLNKVALFIPNLVPDRLALGLSEKQVICQDTGLAGIHKEYLSARSV
jgi:hypothetical protein